MAIFYKATNISFIEELDTIIDQNNLYEYQRLIGTLRLFECAFAFVGYNAKGYPTGCWLATDADSIPKACNLPQYKAQLLIDFETLKQLGLVGTCTIKGRAYFTLKTLEPLIESYNKGFSIHITYPYRNNGLSFKPKS